MKYKDLLLIKQQENRKWTCISKIQVYNIFRDKYCKPLKSKTYFYLKDEPKKKRMHFCKKIMNIELDGKK